MQVLNRARKALPAETSIWITAAQLEEAQGNNEMAEKIVQRALKVGSWFMNCICYLVDKDVDAAGGCSCRYLHKVGGGG